MKVLTGKSFALVELDFADFLPRSTDFIHLAGDFPMVASTARTPVILDL
jgi:hypothetical protein